MPIIAGVDEVGRGPLAGPVLAAAVVLSSKKISGLRDSKKITAQNRTKLCALIKENAIAWAIGMATVEEIDTLNILNASLLAMERAVCNLSVIPDKVLVDGNRCPKIKVPVEAIIKGDDLIPAISAASIVAKVMRDQLMSELDKQYPQYQFSRHKGYATPFHLHALARYGVTPLHRRSFAPVKMAIGLMSR